MIPKGYELMVKQLRTNGLRSDNWRHQRTNRKMTDCIMVMSAKLDAQQDLIERLKRERDELAARLDREIARVAWVPHNAAWTAR